MLFEPPILGTKNRQNKFAGPYFFHKEVGNKKHYQLGAFFGGSSPTRSYFALITGAAKAFDGSFVA